MTPSATEASDSSLSISAPQSSDPQPKVRVERVEYGSGKPSASIIIPTRDGDRSGLLEQLLDDLRSQSLQAFEVLLIVGDNRQGRAINRGVDESVADIVFTMDDDTVIGHADLLENLIQCLEENPDLGIVGASTVIPRESSWFQRVASRQIPRRLFPVVEQLTDSDMVQHPCLAMRKSVFREIGGEDEELVRGLDPLLRHRAREAGYRVAIAPSSFVSHPLPESFWRVIKMYYRNGKGSAFAQRHFPHKVYNLSDGFQNNDFPARISFRSRVFKYPLRVVKALVALRWIELSTQLAYISGYAREYFFGSSPAPTLPGVGKPSSPPENSFRAGGRASFAQRPRRNLEV